MIPQGSKLIGTYDSSLVFGQSRVFPAWTRLILQNGRSLDLPREPAANVGGYAVVLDSVDYHWRELLGAALLSTVLAVGTQAGASDTDSALIQALPRARRGVSTRLASRSSPGGPPLQGSDHLIAPMTRPCMRGTSW
jgi:type IV secretion system protein TrbI